MKGVLAWIVREEDDEDERDRIYYTEPPSWITGGPGVKVQPVALIPLTEDEDVFSL